MRSIRSVALLLGAVLVAAVLVAPPAVAERYTESDPAGDMGAVLAPTFETVPAPSRRKFDIRRVTVRHSDNFVSIRAVMRAMPRPRGDESFLVSGVVKVNPGAQATEGGAPLGPWQWEVKFDESHPQGYNFWLVDTAYHSLYGCDDGSWDEGFKARANYDRNRVTLSIPRGCLAPIDLPDVRPKWVRVSVTIWHTIGTDLGYYFDPFGADLSQSHFTPRLYPG